MKKFYLSKTFWFNILAAVVVVAGYFGYADFEANGEMIAAVIAIINLALRLWFTKGGVSL